MKPGSSWLWLLALFGLLLSAILPTHAIAIASNAEPVRIGILAYRPKPQTQAQWQTQRKQAHKMMIEFWE